MKRVPHQFKLTLRILGMNKPDFMNWEHMSIKLQAELLQERDLADRYQEKVKELEADIDQLKTIIEYLEVKLGINHPV